MEKVMAAQNQINMIVDKTEEQKRKDLDNEYESRRKNEYEDRFRKIIEEREK